MEVYVLAGIDLALFLIAFSFSMKFLRSSLFAEQELKHGRLNQYIFSFTFGQCVAMLGMFLQEIVKAADAR